LNPIIFLDMDGVVVTYRSITAHKENAQNTEVDPACASMLNRLVGKSGAHIVISSTWRSSHSLDEISNVLRVAGFAFPHRVIDKTPRLVKDLKALDASTICVAKPRRDEISAWLRAHPGCKKFVILDDDKDAEIPGHYVRTNLEGGLQEHHVRQALRILEVNTR
jgi:hypothetical protein